jgi:branched-chain amino acid transport system permease protein
MAEALQYLVTGLLNGGVYALMSLGLALIFGVMRIANFAQGDFLMLGMYVAYLLVTFATLDPLLAAMLTIPPFFFAGAAVYRVLLVRLRKGGDPQREMDAQLIVTLGLSLVMSNATLMLLSPTPRGIASDYATTAFVVGPLLVNQARFYAFGLAMALSGAVYAFLKWTDLGKAIRAAADDPEAAAYQAINVKRVHASAFGIGIALAAAAGALIAMYHPITPTVGMDFIILMFVAVVLGGMGSIFGALLGGLLIGFVQSLTLFFLPFQLQNIGVFVAFLLTLYMKPSGLFGQRRREV